MDVAQAASFLNLARATVYEKTSRKVLPNFKKGNKIMFNRTELVARMESERVEKRDEI